MKAFDTVPREAMFAILRRFGSPDHFGIIVIRLHENALINVKIGEDDSEVESSAGFLWGPGRVLVHHAGCNGDLDMAKSQACFPHPLKRCNHK